MPGTRSASYCTHLRVEQQQSLRRDVHIDAGRLVSAVLAVVAALTAECEGVARRQFVCRQGRQQRGLA